MPQYKSKSNQEFHKDKPVKKSRKAHKCCSCGKTIPAKSSYIRTVGVAEGHTHHGNDFFSHAWHKECLEDHRGYIAWNLRRQG
jgi:hypothetical protein